MPLNNLYVYSAVMLAASLATATAPAGEAFRGPVAAQVQRVVDGDTLEVRATIWIDQTLDIRVRIDGVDAPELHSHCAEERQRAEAARQYLAHRIGTANVLTSIVYDKYGGRVRASVSDANGNVGTALIAKGFARPYHGERRQPWCSNA